MRNHGGTAYLITALGGGVAVLCLVLGFHLLAPDLPEGVTAWLADAQGRNGLILALGGALLSFLLGSGFVVAVRRTLASPWRRIGDGSAADREERRLERFVHAESLFDGLGQELATLSAESPPGLDSLDRLQQTVSQLRDTVQQTEEILRNIDEVSRSIGAASAGESPPPD